MESTINERIKVLYKRSGQRSVRSYALKIGVAPTTLNECIKGAEPRFSLLSAILNGEPSISAEWLLRNIGEMEKSESSLEIIEELKAENNMLKGENRVFREQLGLGARKESKGQSA
ncbi:hypothetical protein ACIXJN_09965 [Bacteroides fragilis]